MKGLLNITLFFTLLLSLSGCLWGNGEGYGNKGPGPASDQSIPGADGFEPTQQGKYYEMDPKYSCPASNEKRGYKRAIELQLDGALLLTHACDDSKALLSWQEIEFSRTTLFLGYREGIFEKKDSPPVANSHEETYAEALCMNIIDDATGYPEVVVKNSELSGYPIAYINFLIGEPLRFSDTMIREADQNAILYQASGFLLRIDTQPLQNDPFKHKGVLEISLPGEQVTSEVRCRLLKY